MNITAKTRLISLLGYPLSQTFAPQLFNETFSELGMDYFYFPVEVENDNLGTIVRAIRCMNYAGFNVTKPNKIKILEYLDEMDELAEKIGSVNVVTVRDGKLKGFNTDGIGFVNALTSETDFELANTRFLVFGAGGASRAICSTLAHRGANQLVIIDKFDNMSEGLVSDINSRIRKCARFVPFEGAPLDELIAESHVLVNASGVGMYPHTERSPVKKELLCRDLFVVDITYNPVKTRLLLDAEEVGCRIMNGVGMVINQGIKGFALMTGKPEPAEIMRRIMPRIMEEHT